MIPKKLPVTNKIKAGYVVYHIEGNVVDDIMSINNNHGNWYLGKPIQTLIDDGWSFVCSKNMLKKGQKTTIKPSPRNQIKPQHTKSKHKSKLYILCGLPGSGKSTFAKYFHKLHPEAMIINRDSLRTMIHGKYVYDEKSEKMIYSLAQMCILTILQSGMDVIIDETNIKIVKRMAWIELGKICNADISIKYFTEQTNNIENRMKDARGLSEDVWINTINKMRTEFEPPSNHEGVPVYIMKDFIGQQDMSKFNV